MNILSFIVIALLIEALWERIKEAVPKQLPKWADILCVTLIGILVAYAANMDFLAALGIPLQIPYLGMILTGILVSRGANFMHDLLGSVNAIYQSKKDTNIIPPQEINPGGQITNSEKL